MVVPSFTLPYAVLSSVKVMVAFDSSHCAYRSTLGPNVALSLSEIACHWAAMSFSAGSSPSTGTVHSSSRYHFTFE